MQKSKVILAVEKLSHGNTNTKKELIHTLITQTTLHIKELQVALEKKDWDRLRRIAHNLKSTFLYSGMADKNSIAQEVEQLAIEKNNQHIKISVQNLIAVCKEMIDEASSEKE